MEKHIQDSVAQQVSQLRLEMSRSSPAHVVQDLVLRMESQAKEIHQLRQRLTASVQGKMSVQQKGCPPSSSTVPGLKFVDEQTPPEPQVRFLGFVGESYVPPPSQQAYVRPFMMQSSQGVQNPPRATVDLSSRFEPHVR